MLQLFRVRVSLMIQREKMARQKQKQLSFWILDRTKPSFPIPTTIWYLQLPLMLLQLLLSVEFRRSLFPLSGFLVLILPMSLLTLPRDTLSGFVSFA